MQQQALAKIQTYVNYIIIIVHVSKYIYSQLSLRFNFQPRITNGYTLAASG